MESSYGRGQGPDGTVAPQMDGGAARLKNRGSISDTDKRFTSSSS